MMQGIHIEGTAIRLEEVEEKHFRYIIDWRNDPENNRYLNQPFHLTMEKQRAWYEHYLADPTQGLLLVVERDTNTPFATMGWTDHDPVQRISITGRLLVGDRRYRGSALFAEASMLFADYMYNALELEMCYAHIVIENTASIRYHEKYGFYRNEQSVRFPNELVVNGMKQVEYMRAKDDWVRVRKRLEQRLTGTEKV